MLFLRKHCGSRNPVLFWIPGRVSLARNDDSTFPELSNAGSPPAEPGVYLKGINYGLISTTANFIVIPDCLNRESSDFLYILDSGSSPE